MDFSKRVDGFFLRGCWTAVSNQIQIVLCLHELLADFFAAWWTATNPIHSFIQFRGPGLVRLGSAQDQSIPFDAQDFGSEVWLTFIFQRNWGSIEAHTPREVPPWIW